MATEPSESEPTFTPPGSVAPLQDLPEEIIIRTDPAEPVREAWADQQDQPIEVEIETADLLGIEEERGEGAAVGAPVAAEPVVEGPVNYNIFLGEESPPRIIETKSEQQSGSLGAAASSAPIVKSELDEPEYQDIEVDYDAPEEEQEEIQDTTEAPSEGAASGAPEEDGGGPFEPVRRRGARGAKSGTYIKQKAFVKRFHTGGYPALLQWVKAFTRHHCDGRSFEVRKPYLPAANELNLENCTPLIRLVADFDQEEADRDPLLTIARLLNYIPALRTFLNNRAPGVQQEVFHLVRQLRQDHREGIPGSNPLEYYDDPLPVQGAPPGLPWEGLGVQYRKRLQAQDLAQSEASLEHSVVPERQEESAAASSAAPATGQTASGWRPTLTARRVPQQPEGPPPPKVKLVPRPPDEPPAGHHLRQPPYPAPTQRPEEFILPRDRQQVPQHPSGPPRSARLDQARSKPAADRSRGRATARRQDLQQPAAKESRSRRRRHHSEGDHSKGKGARRRRTSHRRAASLTSRSPENKSPIRRRTRRDEVEERRDQEVPQEPPPLPPPAATPSARGAASGAPDDPSSSSEPSRQEQEEEEEDSEELIPAGEEHSPIRSRSEQPKRHRRLPGYKTSVTDRPLVLHPRTAPYPVTRIDNSGTWALIAPARGGAFAQTQIVGEKPSQRAKVKKGQAAETTEKWSVGENTQITHYASDSESYSYTEDSAQPQPSRPAASGKRKQAFPPTVAEQPYQGVVEAPVVQRPKVSPPLPPEPKRSKIVFRTVSIPGAASRTQETRSTATAAPIPPPATAPCPQGAATASAHREPSFGITSEARPRREQSRDEHGPIAYSPSGRRLTVKDPPAKKPKPPPVISSAETERREREQQRQREKATTQDRSRSKNKIQQDYTRADRPEPPPLPEPEAATENWFRAEAVPPRPKRAAPPPPPPQVPVHKPPPAKLGQTVKQSPQGAASSAPKGGGSLAPHRDPDHYRQLFPGERTTTSAPGVRRGDIRWSIHNSFRIALDWHGVLDRLLTSFGVLEPRALDQITQLNSRQIPLEFIVLSFAGNLRSDDLGQQIELFIADANQRGLPFAGYQITRERVGPQGKSDVVAALGINALVDDTKFICNEVKRTGALTVHQDSSELATSWIFALENILANWRGTLEELRTQCRPLKPRPEQYSQDPKSNYRR